MNGENDIWAITSYFNPFHYRSRLQNYKYFRRHLPLRLCTVEHSLDGYYDLEEHDAEILIQISSTDVLWQKERLLNLALTKLPNVANIVVWLDCDVVFSNKYWHTELHLRLQISPVLQCYSELVDLDEKTDPDPIIGSKILTNKFSVAAIAKTKGSGLSCKELSNGELMRGSSPGGAWAARRNLLQAHGFYDAMIMGGADRLFAYACFGTFEDAISIAQLDNIRANHYRRWAQPLFDVVRGQVEVIEGQLLHMWHGTIANRQYLSRHQALRKIRFDPNQDIEIDKSGAWKWTLSATKELKQLVTSYFTERSEDDLTQGQPISLKIMEGK